MAENLFDRITWEVVEGVARITLARPSAGNSLDQPMGMALRKAADRLSKGAATGEIRVGVLAAEGKVFSVGGDLREFAGADDRGAQVQATADELHAGIATLRSLEIPLVSVLHGTAAGGGLGVALAADIVLAAAEAKLVMAYTASGLTPDCGLTWVIPQRVSWARAMDLALMNRVLTGEEAAQWGLISRAVPAVDLQSEVDRIVSALRDGSGTAFSGAKRLMAQSATRTMAEEMDVEAATIREVIAAPDGVEGVNAFLEKRTPVYR
ncbi:enoyl-CoA hydratase-related protein [Arthrobacter sp. NPDC080031]|uniref:enoyl-CoA hydratase/isomerase family protein n=1 Tax=Arthrobacter sp. NPDC080031 TaxID=3155918 RepID=UPI00344B2443